MFKSIFGDKTDGRRYQGVVTPKGSIRFEQARGRLAQLASREKETISDSDVFEFLARGEVETRKVIAENRAKEGQEK